MQHLLELVAQTQGILNSKPLFPASNDTKYLTPITSSHFLLKY